jgi:hypothetical protein
MSAERYWTRWHDDYDDPESHLSTRLRVVQRRLGGTLDVARPGALRLISMCAGQGRDVIETLTRHRRRDDVNALLVELDAGLADFARASVESAGLDKVRVRRADASSTSAYVDAIPADIALLCGVFGNVSGEDVQRTIAELPHLLAEGGTVIWTRHRRPPDRTREIRAWFAATGFDEVAFDTHPTFEFGVGTNRLSVEPLPFRPDRQLFTFLGKHDAGIF